MIPRLARTVRPDQPRQVISLGLDRVSRLIGAKPGWQRQRQRQQQQRTENKQPLPTDRPALPFRVVHVAGTNGKGSIVALTAGLLSRLRLRRRQQQHLGVGLGPSSTAGLTIGEFVSPHLLSPADSIRIGGRPMGEAEYSDRMDELVVRARAVSEELLAESVGKMAEVHESRSGIDTGMVTDLDTFRPTQFEILTTLALEALADAGVDVAVVECGVGGRRDATNVLRSDEVAVSVLARVGLDHVALLTQPDGKIETEETEEKVMEMDETRRERDDRALAAIADEKCGIFKTGVPVVVDAANLECGPVRAAVVQHAAAVGVGSVTWTGAASVVGVDSGSALASASGEVVHRARDPVRTLAGSGRFGFLDRWVNEHPAYQARNLAAAMAAVDAVVADLERSRPELFGTLDLLSPTAVDRVDSVAERLLCAPVPARRDAGPDAAVEFESKSVSTPSRQSVPALPRGRTEIVDLAPLLAGTSLPSGPVLALVDGAHNGQAAAALGRFIDDSVRPVSSSSPSSSSSMLSLSSRRPLVFIVAVSHPRDPAEIVAGLGIGPRDHVGAVMFDTDRPDRAGWVRPVDADEVVAAVRALGPDRTFTGGGQVRSFGIDLGGAIAWAAETAGMDTDTGTGTRHDGPTRPRIVVAGSLYLVSDLAGLLAAAAGE